MRRTDETKKEKCAIQSKSAAVIFVNEMILYTESSVSDDAPAHRDSIFVAATAGISN